MDQNAYMESLYAYIARLEPEIKADEAVYEERLGICHGKCDLSVLDLIICKYFLVYLVGILKSIICMHIIVVTITLNNLSINQAEEMEITFAECDPKQVSAAILTNDMHAFPHSSQIRPIFFSGSYLSMIVECFPMSSSSLKALAKVLYQHGFMDGLSLHYYTLPGDDWSNKGSALDFDDAAWSLVSAVQIAVIGRSHIAAASPVLVTDTEIIHLPGFLSSVFLAPVCINTHWGGVTEDNSFGTHEFFELCEQIGCKTYINGNVGSGTVQEMSEWVEYMTFDGVPQWVLIIFLRFCLGPIPSFQWYSSAKQPPGQRINMAKLYINEKNKKGHINPELYGNFSEHLGRCIYEGLAAVAFYVKYHWKPFTSCQLPAGSVLSSTCTFSYTTLLNLSSESHSGG